jgi:hypothetical protein
MPANLKKRSITKEFIMRSAFPQLPELGIEVILDDLQAPRWGTQAWHLHVPDWLQHNWRYLSQRERALLYTTIETIQLQIEADLGHDRVAEFFKWVEAEKESGLVSPTPPHQPTQKEDTEP